MAPPHSEAVLFINVQFRTLRLSPYPLTAPPFAAKPLTKTMFFSVTVVPVTLNILDCPFPSMACPFPSIIVSFLLITIPLPSLNDEV